MVTIIGIAGGSGSGKTTVAYSLAKHLNATIISTDNYYKDQSHVPLKERDNINYDHPDSIEWSLLKKQLKELSEGKTINIPQYQFGPHTRKKETVEVKPSNYIIVEGILAMYEKSLCDMYNYKIFVDAPEEVRLNRRINRDINERAASEELTMQMWNNYVKPMHDEYVEPSKKYADIIITSDEESIKAILKNIEEKLKLK